MYNQKLDNRKHFCCCCLQSFTTRQISERRVIDCFEITSKEIIKTAKKVKTVQGKWNHH